MKVLTYFNQTKQQVTTHPCGVLKLEGGFRGDTDSWIQVHDSYTDPANQAVPLKSWPVSSGSDANPTAWFQSFLASELRITKGLFVCVSSTDGTYTAASTQKTDLSVELTNEEVSVTVAGDWTTSSRNSLQVLTQAEGAAAPKRLYKVDIITGIGGNSKCLMVFANDTPIDGDTPVATLFAKKSGAVLDTAATYTATFGAHGLGVHDKHPTTGAVRQGINLVVSNTTGTLTTSTDGETVIRAETI